MRNRRNCTHPVDTACSWCAKIRLCQSAAPIGIRYCFSVTLQSDLVLAAIAIVIAILVLAMTATLLELDNLATPLPQVALTLARKVGCA